MLKFINNLPQELVHKIKEYVLSREVILKLFYQKHEINEETLEKKLSTFTIRELEKINWKYLYYKIYRTSPPRYDNDNLVSIFNELLNPPIHTCISESFEYEYEPLVIYNPNAEIFHYQLNCITRSDYYPENTHIEIEQKKQQYKNIIDSWKCIHEGNKKSVAMPNEYPITKIMYNYLLNMEYELIRAIYIMASGY